MTTNEGLKLLLDKAEENGISTAQVSDGRLFAVSKKKLGELLKQIDDAGKEVALIFIKDPGKVN